MKHAFRPLVLAVAFITALVGIPSVARAQLQGWCKLSFTAPQPPQEAPTPPCQGSCGTPACTRSPCFVGNGAYTRSEVDLTVSTSGPALQFARRYDSVQRIAGIMGVGWSSTVDAGLGYFTYATGAASSETVADITLPDGEYYEYTENSDGATYADPIGRFDTLVKNPDGSWDLTLQHAGTKYHFTPQGALAQVVDEFGNAQDWTVDGTGRVAQITDELTGRWLSFSYGGDGRLATVQDSAGRSVQLAFDSSGLLAIVTNPVGLVTTYNYAPGRFVPLLSQIRDNWNRVITDVTYDSNDETLTYTEDGETYTYVYRLSAGTPPPTRKYDSLSSAFYYFNSFGQVTQENLNYGVNTDPWHNLYHTYYPTGLLQEDNDGYAKTYYTYDGAGRVSSVTRDYQGSLAIEFDYQYDPNFPDKVVSVTPRNPSTGQVDPNWQAWRYDYYQAGDPAPGALHHVYRVERDGTTLDTIAVYTYDAHGRVLSQTTATGGETDYAYDAPCGAGNLCSVTGPANNDGGQRPTTTYGYDAAGHVTSVTDPQGNVTTYQYDALDRVTSVTLPEPSAGSTLDFTTTYSYDHYVAPLGHTGALYTFVTDPNGVVTQQGYDQYGRLLISIDGKGNDTNYFYSNGLLTSITDANNNVTSYSYDGRRRLASTTFPDGSVESYGYRYDNLLQTKTDRKGQAIWYSYDSLKRLISKSYPNSSHVNYTYTGQLLTSVSDNSVSPAETHTFQYDASYRLAQNTQASRGTLVYAYNQDDTVSSYTVQGGPTATYTYYPDGSVDTIGWSPVAGTFKYAYTLGGQYQTITFPNGQTRNYTYDGQDRLTQLANLDPSGANLATSSYTYDGGSLGQRTGAISDVPAVGQPLGSSYGYDADYQLTGNTTQVLYTQFTNTTNWAYDAIGNMTSISTQSFCCTNTTNFTYFKNGSNPLNGQRLQSDGSNTYAYDANGSTTSQSGTSNYTFGWDFENRMTGITGATTAAYTYDYQGRRSSKTVGTTTTYLYNGLNLVQQQGTNAADFLFGPGIDEPLAMSQGGNVYYYGVDGLGSVLELNDASGTVQDAYQYDAWGIATTASSNVPNPFGYTGREFGELGDWYDRTRYYDPTIGRFQSEDMIRTLAIMEDSSRRRAVQAILTNPVQFPGYVYVGSNPITSRDPLGLNPWDDLKCLFYGFVCNKDSTECRCRWREILAKASPEEVLKYYEAQRVASEDAFFVKVCFLGVPSCKKAILYCGPSFVSSH